MGMRSKLLTEEHLLFQESVEAFLKKEAVPHLEKWEDQGIVDREIWTKAGEIGMLCMDMPEEYGGLGIKDFRYNAIVTECMARLGVNGPGFVLQLAQQALVEERQIGCVHHTAATRYRCRTVCRSIEGADGFGGDLGDRGYR